MDSATVDKTFDVIKEAFLNGTLSSILTLGDEKIAISDMSLSETNAMFGVTVWMFEDNMVITSVVRLVITVYSDNTVSVMTPQATFAT
jgi:hypothetical protein